jgi:hypothetical protein
MRQRLEAAEVRQAQELVEALRKTEMGEALAQAEPAAILLRLAQDAADNAVRSISIVNGISTSTRGKGGGWGALSSTCAAARGRVGVEAPMVPRVLLFPCVVRGLWRLTRSAGRG